MRILHILDHSLPLQSGYAFRTVALLNEQRALGWETSQLTTPKHYASGPDEEDIAGLHFFRTRMRPKFLGRVPLLDNAMVVWATQHRIADLLERIRPDIIHAHSPCLNGLAALRATRNHGIPVVYELRASWEDAAVDHGSTHVGSLRYRLSRALETHVLKRADAVTTICHGLAREIISRGVPPDQVTVIPNGVNVEDFEVIERPCERLRGELELGAGPVLGFVGSFYGYEGLDVLIAALPQIRRSLPDARVLLVGGGPAEAALKRLAADLGLTQHVRFAGRIPHDDVRRYYSVIDLLVYPRKSTRLTETVTPLKPLEAMALGRLFIASDVGGHRELIPAHLGIPLFVADDLGELARTALHVLKERDAWPSLRQAGRRYVAAERTWRVAAARYRDVYARLARVGAA